MSFQSGDNGGSPLDLVKLRPLMERSSGRPETTIALIDGPVATNHPDLSHANIREVSENSGGACARADSAACMHGTMIAGILVASRDSVAPAICPNCTLVVRPIFAESQSRKNRMPSCDYILDNCERNGGFPRALCRMCARGHCFSGVEKPPQLLDPFGHHPGGF